MSTTKKNFFEVNENVDIYRFRGIAIKGKVVAIKEQEYDDTYGHSYVVETNDNNQKEQLKIAECLLCDWNGYFREFLKQHPAYLNELD